MKVLVACEFSGRVRDAFRARGHDAWSCDLIPTEVDGLHIQGDVFDVLGADWDLMIAHPPCTYLCNSGARWLYNKDGTKNEDRWREMKVAAGFFWGLLCCGVRKIAVENPIPHKHAIKEIGRTYDQLIQPYQFGHPERKATCLWLKGLPKLKPTKDVRAEMEALPKSKAQRIHYTSPGPERAKIRSITFQGIADAMAGQWGNCVSS